MADLFDTNRQLMIKKYNRDKMVALAQIESREIRIMELEQEIERNRADIVAQNILVASLETEITKQQEEIQKEQGA